MLQHHHHTWAVHTCLALPAAGPAPAVKRRRSVTVCASGGGLFGGLFGGKQTPQQQQQQQQQQSSASSQPAAPAQPGVSAAGTPDNPEFPPYRVLQKGAAYDLRFYDVFPVVEMDYTRREEGYLALGSYQGGANSADRKYGHTQPVVMCYHPDGRKVMQMMVGTPKQQASSSRDGSSSSSSSAITALPTPSDPAVRLAVSGGEVVAVMPFEGYITPEAAASVRQQLVKALAADGLSLAADEAEGFFRVAQYGQVYTLQTRLNEMMLKVQL